MPSSLTKIHLILLLYSLYKSIVTENPHVCNKLQLSRGLRFAVNNGLAEILIINNGYPFTSPWASTTIICLMVITLFHLIVY